VNERKWEEELVRRLTKLADPHAPNRGVLSRLRRALTAPVYVGLTGTNGLFRMVPNKAEERAVLAAALFAWTKGALRHTPDVNFGVAFGAGLTEEGKQQREKRFIDLLDTDWEDLPYKLRQAVALIGAADVGLDWALLIRHLGHWSHPERWVQKEWARGYWTFDETEKATANAQAE